MNLGKFLSDSRKVLIVDDCNVYRSAIKGMLLKLGFNPDNIALAADAQNAMAVAKSEKLKMLFCDYNLGTKANGQQLMTDMYLQDLLPADCVTIVITGDSSKEVVTGFSELEPDGYLIEPLNYSTLSDRLPKWINYKTSMTSLYQAYKSEQYAEIISTSYDFKTVKQKEEYQLFKARSFLKLGSYDEALNTLAKLSTSNLAIKASLYQAQAQWLKGDTNQSKALLETVLYNTFLGPKAQQLMAEIHIAERQYSDALLAIDNAIMMSEGSTHRLFLKILICLSELNLNQAIKAAEQLITKVKYTSQERFDFYLLLGGILIDAATLSTDKKEKRDFLKKFENLLLNWRKRFAKATYIKGESLLLARFYLSLGQINKHKTYLDAFNQLCIESSDLILSTFELLEHKKLSEKPLQAFENATLKIEHRDTKLLVKPASADLCLQRYFSLWSTEQKRTLNKVERLFRQSEAFSNQNYHVKAVNSLLSAYHHAPLHLETNQRLVVALTKAWPDGWSKQDVTKLISQNKEVLLDPTISLPPHVQQAFSALTAQTIPS